jgi:hypothetical protein
MTYGHAWLIWRITSLVLGAIFLVAATIGLFTIEGTQDIVIWAVFLYGGAALVFGGQWAYKSSPVIAAVLVSLGALAGSLALFWTLVVPLAAAVLVALGFALARRPTTA